MNAIIKDLEAQIESRIERLEKETAELNRRLRAGKRAGISQAGKNIAEIGNEISALTLTRALLLENS